MRPGVRLLGPGTGSPAVARPGGGEVEEGVDDRVVRVGVPDETGSDVWAVAERERDHARVCETVGHPGGQGADGPAGGDDLEALSSAHLTSSAVQGPGPPPCSSRGPNAGHPGVRVRAPPKRV